MTTGKAPQFEIPTDMRKLTEQSMEQVKTAISAYLDFCKRSVPTDVLGGSALGNKSPEAVTDQSVKEFSIWLETRTHCPKPQDIVRRVPLLWNEASADIEGWPKSTLTRISFREPRKAQGSLDLLPMNTLYLVILLLNFQCGIVSRTSIRKTKSEGGRELTRKDRYQPEISPSSIRSRMSAATIPALAAAARSSRDAACNDFRATWSGYGRAACEVAPI
jgi:hypothetical protein